MNLRGFLVEMNRSDGARRLLTPGGLHTGDETETARADGAVERVIAYSSAEGDVRVDSITVTYPGSHVIERRLRIANVSASDVRLTRVDTVHDVLPKESYTLDYFECLHNGVEFTPKSGPLVGTKVLEGTAGRSSRGMHPWFTLRDGTGGVIGGAVAWSGNWIIRFEPEADGLYRVSGGLSNWMFAKRLRPGETMESVPVLYAYLPQGGLNEIAIEFGSWGKRFWYPSNEISRNVPLTWNHWWPYEDSAINEDVFKANVDVSAELGLEVCTLDAGWFGEPDPHCNDHLGWSENVDWYLKRGDWRKINTIRFPSGIRALSDYVHGKGLKFGIWCEIEALGVKADLNHQHPEFVAKREGEHLGYVCLANPAAREWAFGILEHLIVDYKADWIKLDFNLDPKAGCNRTDHGHGEGDGLFEHYQGYYELLERVRAKYPEVYLENCSSGGLRIDLGLAKHTHGAFLSDPDHTRHHLQLFWGASTMLHPSACFHFTWSQTIVHYDSNIDKDPIKPDMPRHKLDYIIRANMLNGFGISYRLPELPDWVKARLKELVDFYKYTARRFVGSANMYRLTGPTLRDGGGEGWNAFAYVASGAAEALVFVFRLAGSAAERVIAFEGLDADADYEVRYTDGGRTVVRSGKSLMDEGLLFGGMEEESSEVLYLVKK
ncbi:alpha-galactosidase [Paenibacillus thermotolerans]|uniref:alpha-galactosidase n=1 Tax=Paenibacillus thermotolerans TaxID=3027807 RepID=UPI002368BFA4|nr:MULTISPECIES: alpha-galactosidase [unclassified Paenibacillus]